MKRTLFKGIYNHIIEDVGEGEEKSNISLFSSLMYILFLLF